MTRLDPKHTPLQVSDCGQCRAFQLPKDEKVLKNWIGDCANAKYACCGVPTQKTMEKCNAYDGKSAVGDTAVKLPSYQNIIQNQKEKPNRTGEAIAEAAERICDFNSTDNEVIDWDVVDNEVVDCDAGEEFNDLCCSPCAEEEWLPSQCCDNDIRNCRTNKQHKDDATAKY